MATADRTGAGRAAAGDGALLGRGPGRGRRGAELSVDGATVGEVLAGGGAAHPGLAPCCRSARCCSTAARSTPATPAARGRVLEVLPPFAGG